MATEHSEGFHRIRELFDRAVDLPAAERSTFLDAECGDDPEVRAAVAALLANDTDDDDPVDSGAIDRLLRDRAEMRPVAGTRIGPFRLVRVIGTGGMGTVYEAEQDEPRRRVALKTMRFGLDSPEALSRFKYESDVLASLQHPGIAQVYEVGTHTEPGTELRVPYFAMELVEDGVPLNRWLADSGADLRAVLDTFVNVCEAVHHGHQKGFIHRDLKPANVLVDRTGAAKVIDFGIAKATEHESRDRSLMTGAGELLGTLQYMSPEQLDGDSLDITSDVYSLGVMLYELLTGRPPFELRGKSVHAAVAVVRDHEPVRPTSAGVNPSLGERRIPRELEWIVLRAMDGDRNRRYPSASELAADLRRFVANEPVLAGPPSASYRLKKLAQRYWVGLTGVAAILLAIVGGGVWAAAESVRASRAEAAARTEADTLREVNEFLQDLFRQPRPDRAGKDVRVFDCLEDAAAKIDATYRNKPRANIALRQVIGSTFVDLDALDRAGEEFARGLELARKHLGPEDPATLSLLGSLGTVRSKQGRYDEAQKLFELALATRLRVSGEHDLGTARALQDLGMLHRRAGHYKESERYLRRAVRAFQAAHGGEHADTAIVRTILGQVLAHLGQTEEAERLLTEAHAYLSEHLGPEDTETTNAGNNLAMFLMNHKKPAQAVEILETILPVRIQRFGETHSKTLACRNNLAVAFRVQGKLQAAEAQFKKVVAGLPNPSTPSALGSRFNLCVVLEEENKLDEALALYEPLMADAKRRYSHHYLYATFHRGYGACLAKLGRFEEAKKSLDFALERLEKKFGPKHLRVRKTLETLVMLYERWGKPEQAERYRARLAAANR